MVSISEIINCTSFEKCFIISYTSSNQSRDCEEDQSLHRSPSLSPVLSRISSFSPERSPPLSPESSSPLSSALPLSSKSMTTSESLNHPPSNLGWQRKSTSEYSFPKGVVVGLVTVVLMMMTSTILLSITLHQALQMFIRVVVMAEDFNPHGLPNTSG